MGGEGGTLIMGGVGYPSSQPQIAKIHGIGVLGKKKARRKKDKNKNVMLLEKETKMS